MICLKPLEIEYVPYFSLKKNFDTYSDQIFHYFMSEFSLHLNFNGKLGEENSEKSDKFNGK